MENPYCSCKLTHVRNIGAEGDYYTKQDELLALNAYVRSTPYIDNSQAVTDWYQTFLECVL